MHSGKTKWMRLTLKCRIKKSVVFLSYESLTYSLSFHPSCRLPLLKVNAVRPVTTFRAGCLQQPFTTAAPIHPTQSWAAPAAHSCSVWRHRVHLRLLFLKSLPQKLLTPVGVNYWNISRKSKHFCTVLDCCPWFAYSLSKPRTFFFSIWREADRKSSCQIFH